MHCQNCRCLVTQAEADEANEIYPAAETHCPACATRMSDEAEQKEFTTSSGATLYMTDEQAERWNAGETTEEDAAEIICLVPTSEPDRSSVRDGEVIVQPGLPTTWQGSLADCEREHGDWYESRIADCSVGRG